MAKPVLPCLDRPETGKISIYRVFMALTFERPPCRFGVKNITSYSGLMHQPPSAVTKISTELCSNPADMFLMTFSRILVNILNNYQLKVE